MLYRSGYFRGKGAKVSQSAVWTSACKVCGSVMTIGNHTGSWLIRPNPKSSARVRLFCFPYAGGGPSAFRGWANGIDDVEFCLIHTPGRENRMREKPFSDMGVLIETLAPALADCLDRPYALYGHSLGGLVAFEFAREVRRRGWREPSHLFVSASRAPHLPAPYAKVHHLPDMDLLLEVNRRYEGVPLQLLQDAELRELLVPCLRADLALLETYQYVDGEPLNYQITCIGATGDKMVAEDALRPWRMHSRRELEFHMLEGGHLFLQTARGKLLEKIRDALSTVVLPSIPDGAAFVAHERSCG